MVETEGEQFSLRWNNFHSNLTSGFHALLQGEDLVDVTLAAAGQFVQAHKIVLSVCSPYFKELFKVNPCRHPIVILKDVGHKELVAILQFMYQGEVNVQQEELSAFLKTAEMLQIKGLTGDDSPSTNVPTSVPDTPERTPASRTQQPSLLEPLVVQSEDPPVRPYKRLRSEASAPPPSSASVSSPCVVNEDTNIVEIVEISKPKVEPVEYESDIEEVDKLPNQDDPLAQLLGGESSSHSHQDSVQGATPIFASIPGLSQDSGGSQDGGQGWLPSAVYIMECPLCSRGFRNKFNLKVHMRDVHGDDQGPFSCPECGKQVKNRSCLRVHLYRRHQALKNISHSPVTLRKTQ
ncbi:broad-complex core protein isoforms 1/2/3/4/5 isoform X8 [Cryptotermes secundus]|uniref:broad-complex core protein isoforms 1/2/3/4/5 isoform X8 n=1 Tax=Cryptotermes secundus TaxID=105785 RepID=UPI000CD7C8DB|nr:broad-complex core protein isoforms 1/2/3/4/5 isoform X8 [Cryptotermes secundus]